MPIYNIYDSAAHFGTAPHPVLLSRPAFGEANRHYNRPGDVVRRTHMYKQHDLMFFGSRDIEAQTIFLLFFVTFSVLLYMFRTYIINSLTYKPSNVSWFIQLSLESYVKKFLFWLAKRFPFDLCGLFSS